MRRSRSRGAVFAVLAATTIASADSPAPPRPQRAANVIEAPAVPEDLPILRPNFQPAVPDPDRFEPDAADAQLRTMLARELRFLRGVCQPTPEQDAHLSAAGEAAQQTALKQLARHHRDRQRNRQFLKRPDPQRTIVDALKQSARTTLTAEQFAAYQDELQERAAARQRAVAAAMVARIDEELLLSPEQRAQLAETLAANWQANWEHAPPPVPEALLQPLLTPAQRSVRDRNRAQAAARALPPPAAVDFRFPGIGVLQPVLRDLPPPGEEPQP